jgi:hypothetical protein
MSHVTLIDLHIKDLDALKTAAKMLGLEFVENQKTFKWYGRSVGDYPMPTGFTAADMGRCDHAIRIPGNAGAYEVGVVRRRDGKPGYALMWDFWNGGYGLRDKIGNNGDKLRQGYSEAVATNKLRAMRFRVQRTVTPQGKVVLTATR